jgi:tRNA A-37 threonylcarbamoyl transferase component Bud32
MNQSFFGVEELTINPAKVVFRKEDEIGSGSFGTIYRATDDGINYDNNVVVKKIRLSKFEQQMADYLKPMYERLYGNKSQQLRNEVNAQNMFSQQNIAPRVFYADYEKLYYVMEKMDMTLEGIFRENMFTVERANKMIDLLERSFSTNYIHMDLTTENMMWSNKLDDFRIIDWGIFFFRKDVKDPRMRSVIHDSLIWQLQWVFKFLTDKDSVKWNDTHARYLKFVKDSCYYDDKEKCLVFSPKYSEKVTPETNAIIAKNIKSEFNLD